MCADHPFRKGAVCPFVPSAIKYNNIYFTYFDNADENQVCILIDKLITEYLGIKNASKNKYLSIIVLFPENYSIETLAKVHIQSKIPCINNHIMLGVLFADNNAPSLHSTSFFPLRTQVPCLVMRDLTVHDLLFLNPKHYSIKQRINFLQKFIERFNNTTSIKNQEEVLQAKQLLNDYLQEISNAQ
nr:hypothetical protein [Moraxella cuniculi]